MTKEEIELVRTSWASLRHREVEFAARCYTELFRAQPHLRVLFDGFLDDQHRKLGEMISHAVDGLDSPETLAPVLHKLGQRHKDIGVRSQHHAAVAGSMLAALAGELGNDFTPAMRSAWTSFYAFMQNGMGQQ